MAKVIRNVFDDINVTLSNIAIFTFFLNMMIIFLLGSIILYFFHLPLLYAGVPAVAYFIVILYLDQRTDRRCMADVSERWQDAQPSD